MAIQELQPSITVDQYYQMGIEGILHEDDRVELIEGELHWMTPINSPHAAIVNYLAAILNQQLVGQAVVGVQNPIHLDDSSEPQPDISLARWRSDYYRTAHPTAADVLLVIEVSDSTLRYDRQKKAPLYARLAIPEYWIVNLLSSSIEVYTNPQEGRYGQRIVRRHGEQVAPGAFPTVLIPLDHQLQVKDSAAVSRGCFGGGSPTEEGVASRIWRFWGQWARGNRTGEE